jgi:hypothetical protein
VILESGGQAEAVEDGQPMLARPFHRVAVVVPVARVHRDMILREAVRDSRVPGHHPGQPLHLRLLRDDVSRVQGVEGHQLTELHPEIRRPAGLGEEAHVEGSPLWPAEVAALHLVVPDGEDHRDGQALRGDHDLPLLEPLIPVGDLLQRTVCVLAVTGLVQHRYGVVGEPISVGRDRQNRPNENGPPNRFRSEPLSYSIAWDAEAGTRTRWMLVSRPQVPILWDLPVPRFIDDFRDVSFLGDLRVPLLIKPPTGQILFALGPDILVPTANKREFSNQQWGAGPGPGGRIHDQEVRDCLLPAVLLGNRRLE